MRNRIAVIALTALTWSAWAQDTEWLVEQAPLVSMIVVKAVEKCPSFSARVEVSVSGQTDPAPSSALGTVECQNGNLRWEARLADIKSPQLTESAKAVVRQVNGDQFLLLTRPDQHANYLVLSGSEACLQQTLPALKLIPTKGDPTAETLDGRVCSREKWTVARSGAASTEVLLWKSKELKGIPIQIQFTDAGESIRFRFQDVRLRAIPAERFRLREGLAKYTTVEDLVQSVLISKFKRRIGLE